MESGKEYYKSAYDGLDEIIRRTERMEYKLARILYEHDKCEKLKSNER